MPAVTVKDQGRASAPSTRTPAPWWLHFLFGAGVAFLTDSLIFKPGKSEASKPSSAEVHQADWAAAQAAMRPTHRAPATTPSEARRDAPNAVQAASLVDSEEQQDSEQVHMKQQSGLLTSMIKEQWGRFASTPDMGAEAVAAEVVPYLRGVTDSLKVTAPELVEDLGEEVSSTLCDKNAKDSLKLVMLRMIEEVPDMGTSSAIDCALAGGREDVVTWAALDAWNKSGLEETETISRLKQSATDMRTQRRLRADSNRPQ